MLRVYGRGYRRGWTNSRFGTARGLKKDGTEMRSGIANRPRPAGMSSPPAYANRRHAADHETTRRYHLSDGDQPPAAMVTRALRLWTPHFAKRDLNWSCMVYLCRPPGACRLRRPDRAHLQPGRRRVLCRAGLGFCLARRGRGLPGSATVQRRVHALGFPCAGLKAKDADRK